jgi:hypothetical protein
MRRAFEDTHPGQEFPFQQFSESVYQRRLNNDLTLDSEQFFVPIQAMVAHKMALEQNDINAAGRATRKWVFRHDKVRDYFLMQAVLQQADQRITAHLDDPRFRGAYLMLAAQLPFEQARALRDTLVEYASETRDHFLSDAVVQLPKTRKHACEVASRPA